MQSVPFRSKNTYGTTKDDTQIREPQRAKHFGVVVANQRHVLHGQFEALGDLSRTRSVRSPKHAKKILLCELPKLAVRASKKPSRLKNTNESRYTEQTCAISVYRAAKRHHDPASHAQIDSGRRRRRRAVVAAWPSAWS